MFLKVFFLNIFLKLFALVFLRSPWLLAFKSVNRYSYASLVWDCKDNNFFPTLTSFFLIKKIPALSFKCIALLPVVWECKSRDFSCPDKFLGIYFLKLMLSDWGCGGLFFGEWWVVNGEWWVVSSEWWMVNGE